MNSKKIWVGILAGAALTVLSACLLPVGDGEGLDIPGDPLPAVPPDTNLTLVYSQIFGQSTCRQCHNGTSTPSSANPLNFNSLITARQTLFMPDSTPRLTFQLPGTPPIYRVSKDSIAANSYVYEKVSSSSPKFGSQMPSAGTLLDASQLKLIRRWIERGASLE
jgi:hypothetical protein